jgi:hypothetical protein
LLLRLLLLPGRGGRRRVLQAAAAPLSRLPRLLLLLRGGSGGPLRGPEGIHIHIPRCCLLFNIISQARLPLCGLPAECRLLPGLVGALGPLLWLLHALLLHPLCLLCLLRLRRLLLLLGGPVQEPGGVLPPLRCLLRACLRCWLTSSDHCLLCLLLLPLCLLCLLRLQASAHGRRVGQVYDLYLYC